MKYLLDKSSSYFDFFENHWNNKKTKSIIWFIIVISFILLGFAIEINKIFLSGMFNLPSDLFYSINFVFNLILFYEMIDLIFIMSKSFSIAISKQMEIYSLILVRDSFKLVSDVSNEKIFLNYIKKFKEYPRTIQFNNKVYFVAPNILKAKEVEDVFKSHLYLYSNNEKKRSLSDKDIQRLESYNPQKNRLRFWFDYESKK